MQLTGPVCVCVFVTVCVRVGAFRAAPPHGRGHDTPGLHTLHCDNHLCNAAPRRELGLALRGLLALLRLGDHCADLPEDVCRRRFFPPASVFRWNLFFCCSAVTRIDNKVNMQERGPLWTGLGQPPTLRV